MISKSSNFWVAGSNCHIVWVSYTRRRNGALSYYLKTHTFGLQQDLIYRIHGTEQNHGSEQPRADEHTEMTPEDPMEIQLTSRKHQSGSMPSARVHNNDDSDSDSDEVKHFCAQMSHQYELSINQNRVADRAPGDRMMLQ